MKSGNEPGLQGDGGRSEHGQLNARYGSVEGYLESVNVGADVLAQLRSSALAA